jgi:GAF domain-containing protein/DNA-binding CsgD family transcriptional regulator
MVPVALVRYDRGGRVTASNGAAKVLLGAQADIGARAQDADWVLTDAAGWPAAESVHPALSVVAGGQARRNLLARVTTGAGDRLLRVDAVPERSDTGEVEHVVVSLTDLTDILNDVRLPKPTYGASAIAAVTDEIVKAELHPRAVLETAIATLAKLRAGTWVATLMNKDPRRMSLLAANDADPHIASYLQEMHLRSDAPTLTLSARVIETGEPLLMPSVPYSELMLALNPEVRSFVDEHPPPTQPVEHMGILIVPMRARSSVVGTLGLYEPRSSNPLTPRDLKWVGEIADRVGLAADNAQLYVDAVSRLDRLTALRSVQLAISESPDLRLTLGVILDQAVQALSVDAADILLVDAVDGQLSVVASKGFRSTSIPDYKLPVDEGMPAKVMAGRRIETLTSLGAYSQFRRRSLFAREGFKSYGAVPLMVGGKLAGVLEIFNRATLEPDREWFEFLEALGSDAAIAIERFLPGHEADKGAPAGAASPSPAWTRLQKEILSLVAEGLPNAAIADKVHLSPHTIKFHVGQMLLRAGVHNRTELARKATQERWI